MKIALINDTHFGARNDNPNYANYIYKFWDDIFFPYLEEHNIKDVIHLGDVLDRRKFVNFKTLKDFNDKFVDRLKNVNFDKDPLLLIETIPSRETRNYIKEVLKNYYVYNNKYLYNEHKFEELASGNWTIK